MSWPKRIAPSSSSVLTYLICLMPMVLSMSLLQVAASSNGYQSEDKPRVESCRPQQVRGGG